MISTAVDPLDAFREALAKHGLHPEHITPDGHIHCFRTPDEKNEASWYWLTVDSLPHGAYGSWKGGWSKNWTAKRPPDLDPAEFKRQLDQARKAEAATREREHDEVAKATEEFWRNIKDGPDPADHPYVREKGIVPYGARRIQTATTIGPFNERIGPEDLIIPIRRPDQGLSSLEIIGPDGDKRFLERGCASGCFGKLAKPGFAGPPKLIYVAEGWATSCTILEAADEPQTAVAVALFNANLKAAARALRKKYPPAKIVICADNDWRTAAKGNGNRGLKAAVEAAAASGALVAVPRFKEREDADGRARTDFNDLAQVEGLDAVRAQLAAALTPTELDKMYADAAAATGDITSTVRAQVTGTNPAAMAKKVAGEDHWEPPMSFQRFDLPQFPVEVLPRRTHDFVVALASSTQTPHDLAAMLSLATLAAANAKKAEVVVRAGYIEPLNLYAVTVLPSGERKTAVVKALIEEIVALERAEMENTKPIIAIGEAQHRILKRRRMALEKQASKDPESRATCLAMIKEIEAELAALAIPPYRRFLAEDITPEKLATLLRENDERIAIISDEGGIFDVITGRYLGKGTSPNIDIFLKAHSGSATRVDRVNKQPNLLDNPLLTLGLAVQPNVIRGLGTVAESRGRGLLARFLYSLPASYLGSRDPAAASLPDAVRNTFRSNLRRLLELPVSKEPPQLRFSAAGAEVMRRWEREFEPRLGPDGDLGMMTDWGGELVGATARIAGNLHLAEHVQELEPWASTISAPTTEGAVKVARYLIAHAKAAFGKMGADPAIEVAARVLDRIRKGNIKVFTKRELYRAMQGSFKRIAKFEPVLTLLIEHNFVRPGIGPPRSGVGRKPSPAYEVNPLAEYGTGYQCSE